MRIRSLVILTLLGIGLVAGFGAPVSASVLETMDTADSGDDCARIGDHTSPSAYVDAKDCTGTAG